MRTRNKTRPRLLLALAAALLLPAALAPAAQAEVAWRVDPLASTTAAPGAEADYLVQVTETGPTTAEASSYPLTLSGTLPAALSLVSVAPSYEELIPGWSCSGVGQGFACTDQSAQAPRWTVATFDVKVAVDPAAAEGEVLTSSFTIAGGEAAEASATATGSIRVAAEPPPFGIAGLDNRALNGAGADFTAAARHPDALSTTVELNTETDPAPLKGLAWPVEPPKDISAELPPGLLGNLAGLPRCTLEELVSGVGQTIQPTCPTGSQVGTVLLHTTSGFGRSVNLQSALGPLPLFNMVAPPGAPARLAFVAAGTAVSLDAHLRSSSDYGISVQSENISEGIAFAATTVEVWDAPADHSHDAERACPGSDPPTSRPFAPSCLGEGSATLLRMPTSCTAPGPGAPSHAIADSWEHPGVFDEATAASSIETEGCAAVPFTPSLSAQPTTNAADAPSGLDLHLSVPQSCWGHPEETCQSDLKEAEVRLPAGMTLNPSAAGGLEACSPAQVGLTTPTGSSPIHFDESPVSCPDGSKIGSVKIATPLLEEDLSGAVYLAKQEDNPFGSLLAMYLVAEAPERGVVVKQAGEIVSDPATGRLTTIFREAPQTPFSELHVSLFGGPRAALRTPPACGSYAISARLTPWSGNAAVTPGSGFEIESCPHSGFDPHLVAGTRNPLAGTYSPFSLRLSREDGTEQITGLSATLPPGLVGKPAGIPYCPDSTLAAISAAAGSGASQIAHPSCPAASRTATVTVGAGAGPDPFFTNQGRAYLAGPYKGYPLSIAVVAPAVAGPFDLGNVVVRNALRVNPETAQITAISDPLPTILHGVPLDLRDIRVDFDRPEFTLNPTSCEAMAVSATLTSASGTSAQRSQRFQAAGCDRLGFKPKLSLALKGGTHRAQFPALRATVTMPPGGANIAGASVALPHSEFLAQAHIGTVCTRVQFAADQCPAKSVYGHARAFTPLFDQPLEGPVYLRSNPEHELPDLVAALNGQVEIDLAGRIDQLHGGIRTTFESVPDAPVTKFVLEMPGGKKSLLENSTDICARQHRATAAFTAHNGKTRDFRPLLRVRCGGGGRGKSHR